MNVGEYSGPRWMGGGLGLFAAMVAVIGVGWIFWPDAFFPAYWFGLMFWVQLSIGCLILLLLRLLTGGDWAEASAPLLRRGASGIFILLPFFLPVFLALPHIFSWTNIQVGVSSQVLVNKRIWLNPAAFIVRAILFLAILSLIARRWRRPGFRAGDPGTGWSGPSLVFVILVLSLASCDWMMGLEPVFYSSLYPFMYFSGALVSTLAALCGIFAWHCCRGDLKRHAEVLHALKKLLFASIFFWGYILFSQFIIIWTGNLPDEADWYVVRTNNGWQWLTLFMIVFHFFVPFCVLLSEKLKHEPRRLMRICAAIFAVHFAEIYWLMAPQKGVPFHLNPFDVLLPLLIGGCWLWFVAGLREPSVAAEPVEAAVI